ncbi:unnamed protein product, partial [Amoebophrya sp. A25]
KKLSASQKAGKNGEVSSSVTDSDRNTQRTPQDEVIECRNRYRRWRDTPAEQSPSTKMSLQELAEV